MTEKPVSRRRVVLGTLLKEWLLLISVSALVATSICLYRLPAFSAAEFQVVFILGAMLVIIKGLELSGLLRWLSGYMETGDYIAVKLITAVFVLSMLITNDMALVVVVPLTLSLDVDRKQMLVILEALAANAGSALTPFGNPQNLFIYWYYGIQPLAFITSIAPFSLAFFVAIVLAAGFLTRTPAKRSCSRSPQVAPRLRRGAIVYGILLLMFVLVMLRLVPFWCIAAGMVYAAIFDRRCLKIDYVLLLTFICFFGLAENMRCIFAEQIKHPGHIFMLSALVSQFISNVPTALLLAKFTPHWQALLWGTNAGGFGSLVASLANLIAYRFYVNHAPACNRLRFAAKFMACGYVAFLASLCLYFLVAG